jgi:hypothetical protein
MPNFFARRDYTGLFSNCVQVADTNGDGIPDLIASEEGYIEVLFGNGDGTFRSGPTTDTLMTANWIVAADMNGDGTVDLVQAGGANEGGDPGGVGVSLGNGDGTFQYGVLYPVGDGLSGYAVVGDFNGDGILDVAVTGDMGVWLLTGKGDGTLNPAVLAAPLPYGSADMATADFNGDHKLDVVVTMPAGGRNSSGAGFVVLLGNGDGTFQQPQTFAQPRKPLALAVGSLTKGGHPSIAVGAYGSSTVFLYFGNGAGGFSGPRNASLPGAEGSSLVIGDVNGDGIPDLISGGVCIAFGTGKGGFKSPVYYPVQNSEGISNLVLADLRKNGLADIVTDSHNGISVLLSLGKGAYEDGEWIPVAGGAGCGATADFNRDGKPDLAVNNAQGISILLGTGNAKSPFTAGTSIALANAGCLVSGDLNGDGIPDLLVPANGTVVAYLGNGDGTFTLKSTTATASGGYLALGDFNHDGNLDFATSGNLLALGNGDGTFRTPAAYVPNPPAGGFSNIAVGDINNDGWPDLVLTNLNIPYSNLYVMLNNQRGGFNQVPATFGALTNQAILADVNGDGNLDVIISGISSGGAFVYLGDGTGGFTYQVTLADPMGIPGFNMVADLNGDGIPDIAVLESDTLLVYLGTGGATYAAPFAIGTGPAPGEVLVENLHGQATSAGSPDIVAPDNSGGVRVLINKAK